jgi:hypothetical protein
MTKGRKDEEWSFGAGARGFGTYWCHCGLCAIHTHLVSRCAFGVSGCTLSRDLV